MFLGIVCDSGECRFEAPEDRLEKLEAIVDAIESNSISFQTLEKLAGKCTSLSVAAVPVAGLYMHHMHRRISSFQPTGGRKRNTEISVPPNSGLMFELQRWFEVRSQFNGASWYKAEHKTVSLTEHRMRPGGLIRSVNQGMFEAGGDFSPEFASEHINVQEGYALETTLQLFCTDHPERIAGSTLVVDVDNKVLHDCFKHGRARNTRMHATITDLFWLQVRHDFTLKLRWVQSADNFETDGMSRSGSDDHVRLGEAQFDDLCAWAGGFDMDLMATPASVHKTWREGQCTGEDLPLYWWYRTDGNAGEPER